MAKFERDNRPFTQVKTEKFVHYYSVESLASGLMEEEENSKNSPFNILFLERGVALEWTISPVNKQHALSKKEQRTLPI